MIASDNEIAAKGLGDFFRNLGKRMFHLLKKFVFYLLYKRDC